MGKDNPFEEEEWDEESGGALTDTGEPGVPVRALYDYTGAESDELSFRQGMRWMRSVMVNLNCEVKLDYICI